MWDKKVKMMKFNGYTRYNNEDEFIFQNYQKGEINEEYTIKKVKIGSQIVLYLVNDLGKKIKAYINISLDKKHAYKGCMQSCNSFFSC